MAAIAFVIDFLLPCILALTCCRIRPYRCFSHRTSLRERNGNLSRPRRQAALIPSTCAVPKAIIEIGGDERRHTRVEICR
jgi:hypothetical protein